MPSAADSPSLEAARAVKDEAKRIVARHCTVVGVGLTRRGNGYAVKLNVAEAVDDAMLPRELHGVPLIVEVVGKIGKR